MKKPAKPIPDFPLFPHSNGQWAKKVNGRLRYFGPWSDATAALAQLLGTAPEASNGHRRTTSRQKSVSDSPQLVKQGQNNNGQDKPKKPYPDFPLFPHASGQWAKKIRGKLHYFGPWADPNAALRHFHKEEPDLKAGLTPKREEEQDDVLTVKKMVLLFLEARKLHVESGEMEARTWREYSTYGDRLVGVALLSLLAVKSLTVDFYRPLPQLFPETEDKGPATHETDSRPSDSGRS